MSLQINYFAKLAESENIEIWYVSRFGPPQGKPFAAYRWLANGTPVTDTNSTVPEISFEEIKTEAYGDHVNFIDSRIINGYSFPDEPAPRSSKRTLFSCNNCQRAFKRKCHLSRHLTACNRRATIGPIEVKADLVRVKSEAPLQRPEDVGHVCARCKRVFKQKWHLARHVTSCVARTAINNFEEFEMRLASIKEEKNEDEYLFEDGHLFEDEESHSEPQKKPPTYPCAHCGYTAARRTSLDAHVAKSHPELRSKPQKTHRTYPCTHCAFVTVKKKSFDVHMRKSHPEFTKEKYKTLLRSNRERVKRARLEVDGKLFYRCDDCGKNLYTPHTFLCHVRIHTGERPYTCHLCGKQFRITQGLVKHLRVTHALVRNFPCDVCGRMFASKRNVAIHHRTHTGERPYVCNICGKAFTQHASLFVHSRTHLDVFPFECDECQFKFRTKGALLAHLMRHSGEKPHKCDVCDRSFRTKFELKRHELIHSSEKPYQCDHCKLRFRQKRYLAVHCKV